MIKMITIKKAVVLFLFLFIANLSVDFTSEKTKDCLLRSSTSEKVKIISMLIFHHLFGTFMMCGWVFPNRAVLLTFICLSFAMQMEWLIYGHCRMTNYINNKCNQTSYFRDLIWKFNLKDMQDMFSIFLLILGVLHYLHLSL